MGQWTENLVAGTVPNVYRYAIHLERNFLMDFSSIKTLTKPRRTFTIWRWDTSIKKKHSANEIYSGWRKILTYRKGKWEKEEIDNSYLNIGSPMMPAHMFFKTGEEFKNWLGEEQSL